MQTADMDIGKAFTYVFNDPKWVQKVLIGAGLVFVAFLTSIIVVGIVLWIILLGYLVQLVRNVIANEQYPLPEWADWGNFLSEGAKALVVTIVIFLPALILEIFNFVVGVAGSIASSSNSSSAGAGLGAVGLCLGCLTWLVSLACALGLPVAIGRYAATRNIAMTLRFNELWATFRTNIGTYLIVWLLSLVTGFISGIGFIACGIGLFFTVFYASLVNYHLYGQAYRKAQGTAPSYGQPQPGYPSGYPF
ncbi:MAG TPA: DUF4013 domain-containing protein [Thermomicrobiales bacterium]|nr:DUF4013 domain-containing protein [Thermomicrobiales bacterium]